MVLVNSIVVQVPAVGRDHAARIPAVRPVSRGGGAESAVGGWLGGRRGLDSLLGSLLLRCRSGGPFFGLGRLLCRRLLSRGLGLKALGQGTGVSRH
ncbi:hypothetical protein BN2537_11067 [Streptomyces venezuelae]|nr:hypothetical protein BN2537_11067 [Streptomyces venezuelae]